MSTSIAGLESFLTVVNGRPIPKDPLGFFEYKNEARLFVSVASQPQTWVDDLTLSERFFSEMRVCAWKSSDEQHRAVLTEVQDVLKQRMKYPNIKGNERLEKIAKTWILPTKLQQGPSADALVSSSKEQRSDWYTTLFSSVDSKEEKLHIFKVDVDEGDERSILYSLLDAGQRPSILLVKWCHDLDDHIPTAHCAAHILCSGYSLLSVEGSYALYVFTDQTLYDICSMKTTGFKNPIMESLLQSVSEAQKANSLLQQSTNTETLS
jgi:hypothetical protein